MKRVEDFAEKLARSQVAHPWRFIVASALLTALAAAAVVGGLGFDSSYEALLPEGAPEVRNADEIRGETGGTRQLVVAIGGEDAGARLEFGRALVGELDGMEGIRCTDLELPIDFFRDRGLWLADIDTLDELIPALEEAVKIAKIQANPLAIHLDEEEEKRELDAAWKRVENIVAGKSESVPYDHRVLTSEDGRYTFVVVVPSIKFSDMKAGRSLLERIQAQVDRLDPGAKGMEVRYAGNLKVIQEQHQVMSGDMRNASILALAFGVLIIAGFTRRFAAPFVVGASLVSGVAWTFAMAWVYVGHVNIITGFLGAVIIGLGIDFGIHLFVRFQQEAVRSGVSCEEAIVRMVTGTSSPAITSALTTAGVFFSFTIADFRGFSEFGLIAGTGVLLTMASNFLILPPLLLLAYSKAGKRASAKGVTPPVKSAGVFPLPLAITVIVVMGTMAVFGGVSLDDIPFRNNFKELRGKSEATEFFEYVDSNLGAGFNPAVFVTDSVEDAGRIRKALLEHRDAGKAGKVVSRLGEVLSVTDLLPRDISQHRERIDKLYGILWDPKLDRAADKEGHRADKLNEARRMVKTEPWKVADIPEEFRRRFTTLDGKRYLVYAWPVTPNNADWQAAEWEDELDGISASLKKDGVDHRVADETLIIAWIYRLISADGPSLLIVAAIVVMVFLLLDFRSPKKAMLVVFPLSVGMLVFIGLMRIWGMELNMFNLVVVPSVIGIGIDNAVHIYHRYMAEGRGSVAFVLRNTGVAALLASMTTAVGFGASIISHNVGLKTLGTTAVMGIGATFLAAGVFFPAFLTLVERLTAPKRS